MPEIVICEFMDLAAVNSLKANFDVLYEPELVDAREKLISSLKDANSIIVRNRTKVDAEILDAAPNLKCVGRLGVGLDNIDLEACAERNVAVFPAVGANNLSVAEYVITSAMNLLRNAYFAGEKMQEGQWPRQQCSGRELSGKMLGLVGFGSIAQQTAEMAQALGMQVIGFDPFLPNDHQAWNSVEKVELDDLLVDADVISLHTPLTPETKHLLNAEKFGLMKSDAIVINAARGGVIDETALASAISSGNLGGAALDVFEIEPLTKDAASKFAGMNNVILTPHIAGVTVESNVRVSSLTAETVANHLNQN